MSKNNRIAYLFVVLPILIYFGVVNAFAVNVFFADDFHLLKTIVWSQEANTFTEKFKLFFQQHNEHRIIFPRLLAYTDYLIEGQINWRTLIFFGNMAWVSILFFLWKIFRSSQINPWYFVPIPFVFLQAQYYDNLTWTLSILQQSFIVFWAFLLIYLLSRQHFNWALLVGVVATFTHGNGLFLFLVAFVLLFLQKKWQILGWWIFTFVVLLFIYFADYRNGQNSNVGQSLANPIQLMSGFFAFWGSGMAVFFSSPLASVGFGILLFCLISCFVVSTCKPIIKSFFNKNRPSNYRLEIPTSALQIIGIYLFISITAALVSLSRSWGGLQNILMPRYEHYSPLVVCLGYLIALNLGSVYKKIIAIAFSAFAILFWGMSYFMNISELDLRKKTLEAESYNWQHHRLFLSYPSSFNHNIDSVYLKAEQRQICKMPTSEIELLNPKKDTTTQLKIEVLNSIEKDAAGQVNRKFVVIENQTLVSSKYLVLSKDNLQYLVAVQNNRNSKKGFLTSLQYFRLGFKIFILTENLPKGTYRIGIIGDDFRQISQQITL